MCLAVFVDLTFGEPPEKFHPTVWMGKVISSLKEKIENKNAAVEKFNGALMALFVIVLFSLPPCLILFLVHVYIGRVAYIIVGALLFKSTFAIKCMKQYVTLIAKSIEVGDIDKARNLLPFIVRRDPRKLNSQHIISAAVESTAESTVDGINSPLFYFALLGVPGAIAFRAINTLDSMVGYKDQRHINIGWFSAKLDSLANYIPARLTAVLMVLAALLLRENWKFSWRILRRDKNKTESINAGWPMSAMAGALAVQLEKPGSYVLGEGKDTLSPKHINRALHIMELTVFLFWLLVVIPLQIFISIMI
ncbi:MAG: cobalamin biosynthesis protein [Candidatus Bathyarchaeia archaeon]